jgi:hypothetical protein
VGQRAKATERALARIDFDRLRARGRAKRSANSFAAMVGKNGGRDRD